MNKDLDFAIEIATKAFEGKVDKGGSPYIDHLLRVKNSFRGDTKESILIVAVLHDLLEDCPEWNESILRQFFSEDIVLSVICMTKIREENYDAYIDRVSTDYWATYVKVKDLEDNMNITRLTELTDGDCRRLKKYHRSWTKLNAVIAEFITK